ncbi:unnamed protein product [Prunus brigantina]
MDTSQWPILLKNYDRLNVRTGHYTAVVVLEFKRRLGKTYILNSTVRVNFINKHKKNTHSEGRRRGDVMSLNLKCIYIYKYKN